MGARSLHGAAVGAHVVLLALVLCSVGAGGLPPGWRAAAALAAGAPLALALPGLIRGRRYTCQWLAVVLVLYAGAATVEVVAAAGRATWAALAMLVSLLELGLLVALSRSLARRAPSE